MFTHASKSSGCFSSGDLPLSTGTICPTQSPINDRQGLGCWGKSTMLILKYKFWSPKSLPWDMFHTNFSPLASFKYITHQLLGTCVEYCQYPVWIRQTWRSRWRGWSRRQTWRTSQLQAGIRPGLPAVVVDCPSQLICTWIFICWVSGGDSTHGGVKCLSSYFTQEWTFWTIFFAEYPCHLSAKKN